jgi:hypothetical protein
MVNVTTAWGADVEALRALGKDLNRWEGEFVDAMSRLNGTIEKLDWFGPDSDQFRGEVRNHQTGAHAAIVRALNDAGANLARNASEQADTSSVPHGIGYGFPGTIDSKHAAGSISLESLMKWLPAVVATFDIFDRTVSSYEFLNYAAKFKGAVIPGLKGAKISGPSGAFSKAFGKSLPDGVGKALGVVNIALDGTGAFSAFAEGDTDTGIRKSIDVAWTGVGMKVPTVAAAKFAWDIGWEVGKIIDSTFGISDSSSDAILGSYVESLGGPDDLTTDQATALGSRYDGVEGFGNFVGDAGTSAYEGLVRLFK